MKRAVSVFLVLIMVFTASVAVFANDIKPVNKVIGYENNELLVMYKDGSVDVINYGTTEELRCGIAQYSCDENIIICQPNYSYETVGALTGDEYAYEQWALFNDGTFAMEEGGNQFPVYDTPFGPIRLPYEWKIPDFFGIPGGFFGKEFYITKREVKANPGIDIGMSAAWNTYRNNGREVIVAVVDTGVEYSHEDLKNRMWINTDEIPGNGIDDDWNGYTDDVHGWNFYDDNNIMYTEGDDDHGTHCAGTIVADANNGVGIAGVNQANNIKIMNVKALGGSGGYGTTGSVIRAIQYAEANGATICNLSLGTSINDRALYTAMANSNMLFVAAAGNDGKNTDEEGCYPASYDLDNIISVANLNYDGNLSYSSNYGFNTVDLAAPGSYILSTTVGGYSYMTGTSMSAPFVTAAAAMIYTHYDNINVSDIKEIILGSVKPVEAINNSVKTGGMLDIAKALNYDLTTLSHTVWPYKTPVPYTGSAPVLEANILNLGYKKYIVLSVFDTDDDLVYLSYADGQRPWDFFGKGNQEYELFPDASGKVVMEVTDGIYTFYAKDFDGHINVYGITVGSGNTNYVPQPKQPDNHNPDKGLNDIITDIKDFFKWRFGY